MRRVVSVLAVLGTAVVGVAPSAVADPPAAERRAAVAAKYAQKPTVTVAGDRYTAANPSVALLPRRLTTDPAFWRGYAAEQSAQRAASPRRVDVDPFRYREREPRRVTGDNDTLRRAELIERFGTGAGEGPAVRVFGRLVPDPVRARRLARPAEDNGSIPRAARTAVGNRRDAVRTSGRVGDGPHGSAGDGSGDFDFFRVRLTPRRELTVDIDTSRRSRLDSVVLVYNAAGRIVAGNDDDADSLDSLLRFRPSEAGAYFVAVGGFGSLLRDPFDSGSGRGAGSEGAYQVRIKSARADTDAYAVQLDKGDVLGGFLRDAGTTVAVFDPEGQEVFGSSQDASFIYPTQSPLPGGGSAVVSYVADTAGRHVVVTSGGAGDYRLQIEGYRPGFEADRPGSLQTLFVDFDGARVNTGIWGGPGVRQLSPLSRFLPRWGLRPAQEDALINAIMTTVRENIHADLIERGQNPNFAVRILNSRDDADPWGEPDVSRLIVGGTIRQSGIPTIGIAQSIDPGNYAHEESALILLDVLSSPRLGDFGDASLNHYLQPQSRRVAFVGQAVGNVTAHEAGHYLGSFHVDQFNRRANLMDQGGNFPVLYGAGLDGVGGTADDVDVDFGVDVLNPFEGFTGQEDTLTTTAFGLTGAFCPVRGAQRCRVQPGR